MVLVLDREKLRRTKGDERGQPSPLVVRMASFSPYILVTASALSILLKSASSLGTGILCSSCVL